MKIRLHGTEDECRELAGRLPAITDVLSVSEPYPDRGTSRLVRVYVEARPLISTAEQLFGIKTGVHSHPDTHPHWLMFSDAGCPRCNAEPARTADGGPSPLPEGGNCHE